MSNQYTDGFADNNGVAVHFLAFLPDGAEGEVPVVFVPGMTNSAEEVQGYIRGHYAKPHVIISLRGRGGSDSPETGYTLDDQASDVNAVVEHLGLKEYYLFGHSVGSTVGIRAAALRPEGVRGLVMGDFAPFYPPFDQGWADQVLPNIEQMGMTRTGIEGVIRDAAYQDVFEDLIGLNLPVLVIRAGKDGEAALRAEEVAFIESRCPTSRGAVAEKSSHELLRDDPAGVLGLFEEFRRK